MKSALVHDRLTPVAVEEGSSKAALLLLPFASTWLLLVSTGLAETTMELRYRHEGLDPKACGGF